MYLQINLSYSNFTLNGTEATELSQVYKFYSLIVRN